MAKGVAFQYIVNTQGRLTDEKQFGEIGIKATPEGQVTRLRDVARIELAALDYSMNSKLTGGRRRRWRFSNCRGPIRSRRRTRCMRRWRR